MKGFSLENIKVAVRAIGSQKLRTSLTVMIIAIGIMALVGILTAIEAIKAKINNDFSDMGANTFSVVRKRIDVESRDGRKQKEFEPIEFQQVRDFKEKYRFPALVSASVDASRTATATYRSKKTDPNLKILGGDENYLKTTGFRIFRGRNFSKKEVDQGDQVVILGHTVRKDLFDPAENPLGKLISIGNAKYRVIGVLEKKGSTFGFSGDDQCIIPITTVEEKYGREEMSYVLNIRTDHPEDLVPAAQEAIGLFRVIRGDPPGKENTFEIVKSDNLASRLIGQLSFISISATIIGIITLVGAAIGLMNIMLVSVTERTQEIGIRKSLGASKGMIRRQFLVEAILISQLGGIFGILLGVTIGNLVSTMIGGSYLIPWGWIIGGVIICLVVGITSGYYPARKASGLDPIAALRYE